ncbi:hypothetical protein JQ557_20130 [Bradyrhizobium sp. U87765 SZCCT0131]|uniref:hypothetical protein n=1 Tax=Bradyrhizobium sp. U87765 SZCCT0110 TaxID=2807657 RepID=UPI001BA4B951|nr:hypothetical protein [Bradyrhizobium sp. U87765 SZCCT0110]MBR1220320.1 hypothetical protein [Bradyrhizobium sp. U87765 SZCCT0131]MBR1263225.1 hypothetical protein [Bradyrhizobium sp. U87765 SZCCT0134]MBR1323391.1 hypothetical protein [Bradyrhizobium sp. U87765 SZCCT0109]MBR1345846.1 hypothetical protein [Bradyrhizobium sp. U87765 SZCCT0048]MBR1306892.1 hypothetical protein [Bradyrhizobium sp. U87765 SZCCT0110]
MHEAASSDDGRMRTTENVVLLFVFALLVVAGIWLLNAMADVRKAQDCAVQGRRNCEAVMTR